MAPISQLEARDPWIRVATAARDLGVTHRTVHVWITDGKLRAIKEETDQVLGEYRYRVCTEDLKYLHQSKRASVPLLSLVERGVVPLSCQGMTGDQLQAWSEVEGNDFAPVPPPRSGHLSDEALELGGEDPCAEEDVIDELLVRVQAMETTIQALTATMTGGLGKMDSFSDREVEALLLQILAIPEHSPISLAETETWVRRLAQMSQEHIAQLVGWARRNPGKATGLLGPSLPAYTPVVRLAQRLHKWMEAYPGSDLAGTAIYRIRKQAEAQWGRVREMCLGQAMVDNVLRLAQRSTIPIGHCATDQYVLSKIMQRPR